MNIAENFKTALSAIAANKMRAFLTMLGVIIGVYAVSTMISLGQLATGKITGELNEIVGSQVYVTPDFELVGARFQPFTSEDIEALTALPIKDISTDTASVTASVGRNETKLSLEGTKADYAQSVGSLKLAEGRYFSEIENQTSAPVIVLEGVTANKLFGSRDAVGQTIRLSRSNGSDSLQREDFTVIGVTDEATGSDKGYVPLNYVWRYFSTPNEYWTLFFKTDPSVDQERLIEDMSYILEARRGKKDFEIDSFDKFVEQFTKITGALQAMLAGIGGLSLLVGGIGIMNIMLVSVTERTREIGLRKALGARRSTILGQFLIEAVTLTGLGGLIGYGLSVLTVWAAAQALPNYFGGGAITSPSVALLAIGVSALVGLIFGVWPARRAASLTPIEALRYE